MKNRQKNGRNLCKFMKHWIDSLYVINFLYVVKVLLLLRILEIYLMHPLCFKQLKRAYFNNVCYIFFQLRLLSNYVGIRVMKCILPIHLYLYFLGKHIRWSSGVTSAYELRYRSWLGDHMERQGLNPGLSWMSRMQGKRPNTVLYLWSLICVFKDKVDARHILTSRIISQHNWL